MKKVISLLVVVIFICSALVGCVNQDLESKMKEKYLSQFGIEDKTPEDVVIDYDGGTYNGVRVLMLDAEWHDREEWIENIGETQIQYYDSNRLLAYAFGKFYTLEEAKKYYILSEESIIKIADDFQSQVTHYRDTCDVHDFEEYQFIDNFDIFDDYDPWTNVIAIDLDKRICRDNESFSIADYLGKDIIAEVKNIFDRNPKYNSYSLYICNPGYENMQYVFERLSKIPGVLHAGYYYSFFDLSAESSNDKYYTNYGAWGLEDIEIEKVWDFTVGSIEAYENSTLIFYDKDKLPQTQ